MTFLGHYLWTVFANVWALLLLVPGIVGLAERLLDVKVKIPRWVSLTLIATAIFVAQAMAYWKLSGNPPTVLKTPPPPTPIFVDAPRIISPTKPSKQAPLAETAPQKQPPSSNQFCPSGICIGGDNKGQATVNNYAPEARRLSNELREYFRTCLAAHPGKFAILAVSGNSETFRYAQDWSEVFSSAGWTNEQSIPVSTAITVNGALTGVRLAVAGTWNDATKAASLMPDSPENYAVDCFLKSHGITGSVTPYNDMQTGKVRLDVGEHP
jgi:hypothetical protein